MKLPLRLLFVYWNVRHAVRRWPGRFMAFVLQSHTCDRCGTWRDVERRHMSTCYAHEESNWTHQCPPCFEETEEEWAERWAEYYAGLL